MGKKEMYSSDPDVQARHEAMGTGQMLDYLGKLYKSARPIETEPSSDLRPEVQASLEAVGTTGLLAELAKRYGPQTLKTEPSYDLSPDEQIRYDAMNSSSDVFEHLKQRGEQLVLELEKLPHHRETFRKQELENILRVKKQLQAMVEDFDRAASNLSEGSLAYQALCQQYIKRVMQSLDQESFWAYKFTTENVSGVPSGPALEFSDDDSVYYVTRSGISLRLKRSISEEGLRIVIQPFHENIIFKLPNSRLNVAEPLVGGRVAEYRSKEFYDLLNQERILGNFESPNEIYMKDRKIFFVDSNDEKPHLGDRVNKILVAR